MQNFLWYILTCMCTVLEKSTNIFFFNLNFTMKGASVKKSYFEVFFQAMIPFVIPKNFNLNRPLHSHFLPISPRFLGPRGPLVLPLVGPVRPVRPSALKIWITYIQAYMPYESCKDSSNQPYGPMASLGCPLDPLGPPGPPPSPPWDP